jgi:hypothetical protein
MIPGQLLFRWFSAQSSTGCLQSIGYSASRSGAVTNVSYNSVVGSCGGVVEDSEHKAVGMHIGTTGKTNCMVALHPALFDNLYLIDFRIPLH